MQHNTLGCSRCPSTSAWPHRWSWLASLAVIDTGECATTPTKTAWPILLSLTPGHGWLKQTHLTKRAMHYCVTTFCALYTITFCTERKWQITVWYIVPLNQPTQTSIKIITKTKIQKWSKHFTFDLHPQCSCVLPQFNGYSAKSKVPYLVHTPGINRTMCITELPRVNIGTENMWNAPFEM